MSASMHPIELEQLLTLAQVLKATSWSRTSLYRKIAEGTFPRPIKIGASRIAFRASEIKKWMESRPHSEDGAWDYIKRETRHGR